MILDHVAKKFHKTLVYVDCSNFARDLKVFSELSHDDWRAIARHLRGKSITDQISTSLPRTKASTSNMDEVHKVTAIDSVPQARASSFVWFHMERNAHQWPPQASTATQLLSHLTFERGWKLMTVTETILPGHGVTFTQDKPIDD